MTHTPTCSQCGRAYTDGPCTAPRPLTLGDPAPVPVSTEGTAPKAPPVPLQSGVFAARVRAVLLATLALGCNPVRSTILGATGNAPTAEPCTLRTERCRAVPGGRVPEACGPRGDGQTAYWPATPVREPCAWGCEVLDDGGARCTSGPRRDASVDVHDVTAPDVLELPVVAADAEVAEQ